MNGGYGVVVLETGKLFGGDSSFVYMGRYELEKNGRLRADVKCTNDRNIFQSVFGDIREFNLRLEGTPAEHEFVLDGHITEKPDFEILVKLTRRAELP